MPRSRTHVERTAHRVGLGGSAVIAAGIALVLGLAVAPPEAIQGESQRLMYVHVPAAWTAFLAFFVVCLASLDVLVRGSTRRDAVARAAAELGVGMTALAIVEGSIWGHAAWGVWWTWDPRLVTTAALLLLYVGYLGVRALPGPPTRVRRRAALAGVLFFVQVPVVHFSVLWWRTLHQPPTLLSPEVSPPIDPLMVVALTAAVIAFSLGGLWYVRRRAAALRWSAADAEVARGADTPPTAPRPQEVAP
jgi:heme exporter protein C